MGEASSDELCHCQGCLGKYTLLRDEENPQLAKFERRLPCFGCGIGWSSFLLGFLCPLLWYYATTLYCCKYYNRDPRERPGLAASAIAAIIFTTATIITLSIILIIWAQKWFLRQGEQGWMIGCLSADEGFRRQLVMMMIADRFSSSCNHSGNAYANVYRRASSIDCRLSWVSYSIFLRGWEQLTISSEKLPVQSLQIEFHKLQRKNPYR